MQVPSPLAPSLADELIALLHRRGPLSDEEIADALGEDAGDPDWDAELDDALDGADRVVELDDGRLADAVALLSVTTLTHRVSADEVDHGRLRLAGDLQPFVDLIVDSAPLDRGGRVRVDIARRAGEASAEWLVGPDGWLDDAAAGDLVGVGLVDGLLTVSVRPEPAAAGPAAEALAATARVRLADSRSDPPHIGVTSVLWEALAAAPSAFAGVMAPLSEVAEHAGLQMVETMLLPADASTDELGAVTDAIHDAIARVHYDAGPDQLDGLVALRDVTRRLEVGDAVGDDELLVAAHHLADPDVLDCYLHETGRDEGAARMGAAAAPHVSGTARAAACCVQAQAALAAGDAVAADARIADALAADPAHEPSLLLAARFADLRGDAARALACLDAAGWGDTDWADELRARLAPRRDVGRNEPCPCGSGRKFKVCCAAKPRGGTVSTRAPWLRDKLDAFADVVTPAARLTERLEADGRLADWVAESADHPVVEDVATFELGLLEEFLAVWGTLLPDDERALAASWRDSRRGLYRVEQAHGDQLTVTARADGSRLTVHSVGGAPPRGRVLLARLLTDGGDGWLLSGAVLVDAESHPAVVRSVEPGADPLDVAELWGSDQPVLVTAEEEPMVVCEWRAPLAAGHAEALRAALPDAGVNEDAPGVFVETVEVDGATRVRGSVTVTDAAVVIETNAEARLARLVNRVRAVIGDVDADVDRRTPMWRVVEDRRRYGVPEEPREPSEAEQEALAEAVREHEQRWVDEPVPALDGLTPRQARDHPTGRRALEELLASFPAVPGGMDPDRLRGLLDLSTRPRHPAGQRQPAGSRAAARRATRARIEFAAPPLDGDYDDIDLAWLDPSDADQRGIHIEAEHELAGAWDGEDPHHDPSANAEAHHALHEVVAAQLVDGDPPEVWATAQRLVEAGYDRHEVLHMIAGAVAGELWHAQTAQRPFDRAGYLQRLELLPDSWELDRKGGRER